MLLVGHKGADAVVPGNTVASFERAVAIGVDIIEFDVLWTPEGHPRLPAGERAPLVIAHDWHDAARRTPLTLGEGLDAFRAAPLDRVQINLDIKLPGREEEIVAALRERDLVGRAMISTMELTTLARVAELEPALRRGWTYPKVTRDWASKRWARGPMMAALVAMRRRVPGIAARTLPQLGVESMWIYHALASPRLAEVTRAAQIDLIAWTVDDLPRMEALRATGVTGLCSNDPTLFAHLTP